MIGVESDTLADAEGIHEAVDLVRPIVPRPTPGECVKGGCDGGKGDGNEGDGGKGAKLLIGGDIIEGGACDAGTAGAPRCGGSAALESDGST